MGRMGRKENGRRAGGLVLASLADLPAEETKWLWPGRIARGSLTLLVGSPDVGKSWVALDIAARVSRGDAWPDGAASDGAGGVMLLSGEEHLLRKVRPALDLGQADYARICMVYQAFDWIGRKRRTRAINLKRDLRKLARQLKQQPDRKLVIVDSFNAFMGSSAGTQGVDAADVLGGLFDLAARNDVAVLVVTHLKAGSGEAISRTVGGLGLARMARGIWMVVKSEAGGKESGGRSQESAGQVGSAGRRLFLPVKNNLVEERTGLSFALKKRTGEKVPRVEWSPESVETTADEALRELRRKRVADAQATAEAVEFLTEALADGPRLVKDVELEAKQARGISHASLKRGRDTLKVHAFREKIPGPWSICLAEHVEERAAVTLARKKLELVEPLAKNAGNFDVFQEKSVELVEPLAKNTGDFEVLNKNGAGFEERLGE